LIAGIPDGHYRPALGGAVGFPGGGETTNMKTAQARELIGYGCNEIDMVINVGFIKSGLYEKARDDIRAVKQAIETIPLKVILECHYLSEDEICRASELAVEAGADWVKTSTGWAPTGATLENISLIKKTIGNSAKVKAAGGVKDLSTLLRMADLGAERFGIGSRTVVAIFEEYTRLNQLETL
jgi:deoxyribose-phosphate aldolase